MVVRQATGLVFQGPEIRIFKYLILRWTNKDKFHVFDRFAGFIRKVAGAAFSHVRILSYDHHDRKFLYILIIDGAARGHFGKSTEYIVLLIEPNTLYVDP